MRYLGIFCLIGFIMLSGMPRSFAAAFPPVGAVSLDVPLYIENEEQEETVPMVIMANPDDSYVRAEPVIQILASRLTDDKIQALQTGITDGFLPLKNILAAGADAKFDSNAVILSISVPSDHRRRQDLSARPVYDTSHRDVTLAPPVSAYANFRGGQEYTNGDEVEIGRQPFRLRTDGAVNIKNYVLEGAADYEEGDGRSLEREETRLVHDLPDKMVRLAAGDLSYPVQGFQSFQQMAGISVARNFDLQPYRVSEPTGRSSFFLKNPSRVDVLINGQRVRTLQLDAGPYDIKDFPVVNGSNKVELVITDSSGQVEIKQLDVTSDADLLAGGLHEYAYNAGIISDNENREIEYDADHPAFSFFHRYGVTDALTLGVNAQGDQQQQMAGIEAVMGGDFGIVGIDLGSSRINDGENGLAGGIDYTFIHHAKYTPSGFDGARTVTARLDYLSVDFAPLGSIDPDNNYASDYSLRYSQQITETLDLGLSGQYQFGRQDNADSWSLSASANKLLPHNLRLGVTAQQEQEDGFGAFVILTWTPPLSRHSTGTSYDSYTGTKRVDWNYAEEGRANSFSASAGAADSKDDSQFTGDVTYHNARGEFTVFQDVVKSFNSGDDEDDSAGGTDTTRGVFFGTALAYSGGHVAVSRPIGSSFAMIAKNKSLKDYAIGINEQGEKDGKPYHEASVDHFGPAVLPDVTPYVYRTVRVHARDLPPGYDIGPETYTIQPNYRSGVLIELGGEANVVLQGILTDANGKPVPLQAGVLVAAGEKPEDAPPFFTNREGRFFIEKLKPGHYEMELFSFPGTKIPVTIAPDAVGQVQAGTLTLPVKLEEQE